MARLTHRSNEKLQETIRNESVEANKQKMETVILIMEHWTYSFSLGAQQTRTLSRPIWSPTLLVSITSNARSGGKPFAHRERPSPVHKVTFKQRRNKQWRRRQQRQSQKRKGLIRETTLLVYHTFLRRCCTKTLRLRRNFRLCIPHIAYRSRGTHS